MDASDLIKALQNTLRGGGRPHMENRAAVFTLVNEPVIERGDLTDSTKQPFNDRLDYPKSGSWLGCPLVGVGWDNRGLRFRRG
jgi:hypothetical protein